MNAIALRRNYHAGHARSFTAEVTQDIDSAPDFAFGLRERLALFTCHLGPKLVELAIHDVGSFKEQIASRRSRHRRPCWKRGFCCCRRCAYILSAALRK